MYGVFDSRECMTVASSDLFLNVNDIQQINLRILLSGCFNDKVTMSKAKAIAKISDISIKTSTRDK